MRRPILGLQLPPVEESVVGDVFVNLATAEIKVFDNGVWNDFPEQPGGGGGGSISINAVKFDLPDPMGEPVTIDDLSTLITTGIGDAYYYSDRDAYYRYILFIDNWDEYKVIQHQTADGAIKYLYPLQMSDDNHIKQCNPAPSGLVYCNADFEPDILLNANSGDNHILILPVEYASDFSIKDGI